MGEPWVEAREYRPQMTAAGENCPQMTVAESTARK